MFNKKEYDKEYRQTHKAEIAKQKAEYMKEYRKTSKGKFVRTCSERKIRSELRQQVIELYSHGTCKCSHCGGSVEELHHTDPANGKWERKEFTRVSTIKARKHQLEMYTVIPNYITPLCKKCHKEVHKQLKEEKHYE